MPGTGSKIWPHISETPDGAEAVGALFQSRKRWPEIPDGRDALIGLQGCKILQNVAMHEVGSLVIANPSSEMSETGEVRRQAVCRLSKITASPVGAHAAVKAGVLEYVPGLMDSPDPETQMWTCEMLGNLVIHQSNAIIELGPELCMRVCTPLPWLWPAFGWLWPDKIQSQAKMFGSGLAWPGFGLSRGFSAKFGRMHEMTLALPDTTRAPVVLIGEAKSRGFLARPWPERYPSQAKSHARPRFWLGFGPGTKAKKPWLFGLKPKPEHHYDGNVELRRSAIYLLSKMSRWTDGALAVLETSALEHVPLLLTSHDTATRRWTCEMLGHLVLHYSPSLTQDHAPICTQIVQCLRDEDKYVREASLFAVSRISRTSNGAQAFRDTEILKYVPKLLDFNNTRSLVCKTLVNLAVHGVIPVLGFCLRTRIESLLSHPNRALRETASVVLRGSSAFLQNKGGGDWSPLPSGLEVEVGPIMWGTNSYRTFIRFCDMISRSTRTPVPHPLWVGPPDDLNFVIARFSSPGAAEQLGTAWNKWCGGTQYRGTQYEHTSYAAVNKIEPVSTLSCPEAKRRQKRAEPNEYEGMPGLIDEFGEIGHNVEIEALIDQNLGPIYVVRFGLDVVYRAREYHGEEKVARKNIRSMDRAVGEANEKRAKVFGGTDCCHGTQDQMTGRALRKGEQRMHRVAREILERGRGEMGEENTLLDKESAEMGECKESGLYCY
ncbi:armadillo-type protein [Mycena polygramma]|nr:armadillo-type protein [Mycena polygramma]